MLVYGESVVVSGRKGIDAARSLSPDSDDRCMLRESVWCVVCDGEGSVVVDDAQEIVTDTWCDENMTSALANYRFVEDSS